MSLPTAAKMTHCRPDCILPTQRPTVTAFLNVLFPSVFAQVIFLKSYSGNSVSWLMDTWKLLFSLQDHITGTNVVGFFSAVFLDWIHFCEEF